MSHPGTVLYTWELGSHYGHVSTFLPLARELRRRGHTVILALRDLSQIQALPGSAGFELLQAPVWLPEIRGLPEPQVCYPDILQRFGYLDFNGLTGMLRAWRALFRMVQPDLVLADHAPTALLASRASGIPRALFGSGFYTPPRSTPLPSMRPRMNVSMERLEESERAVLSNVNRVLQAQGMGTLDNLAALFDTDEDFIIFPEEFDHYRERGPTRYYGPLLNLPAGSTPDWPDTTGPKLFAYLKPVKPHFASLIDQLRRSHFSVLAHVPGLNETRRRQLAAPNLRISKAPVDMTYACSRAGAVICNAGIGTVTYACMSGLPVLCLPMYVEQNLTARNAERCGAGIMVLSGQATPDFVALLDELLGNPAYRSAARAFADRYAKVNQQQLLSGLADRCEELLGTGARDRS